MLSDLSLIKYPKKCSNDSKKVINKEKSAIQIESILKRITNNNQEMMNRFYNNINSVNIKARPFSIPRNVDARYINITNTIEYRWKKALNHELFHLASSIYDSEEEIEFSGFRIAYLNKETKLPIYNYGVGINEGFTHYLVRKYSNGKNVYKRQVDIATLLSRIIGEERMIELYFTDGLKGLCIELQKYMDEKEIISFINNMDKIVGILDNTFEIDEIMVEIYDFIISLFSKKNQERIKNGTIRYDDAILDFDWLKDYILIGKHRVRRVLKSKKAKSKMILKILDDSKKNFIDNNKTRN